MACDAASLVSDSKCLWTAMSTRQLLASWALLWCDNPPVPPGGESNRITEDGQDRITEDGTVRIIES